MVVTVVKSRFLVLLRQLLMQNVLVLKWSLHLVMQTFYCLLVPLLVQCVRLLCVLTKPRRIQKSVFLMVLVVAVAVSSMICTVFGVVVIKSCRLMYISQVVLQLQLQLFMVLRWHSVCLIKNSKVNRKERN